MILSDVTLKQLMQSQQLVIDPLSEDALQPASIDCRLGAHFLMIEDQHTGLLRLDQEIRYREVHANTIIVPPKTFLLATTLEYIKLPQTISAFVEGRSSIGRMGLFIQNAGWVDSGFEGRITLELYNANSLPIQLDTGRRICQLVFCEMDQAPSRGYRGKYFGQNQAVGSKISFDSELNRIADKRL